MTANRFRFRAWSPSLKRMAPEEGKLILVHDDEEAWNVLQWTGRSWAATVGDWIVMQSTGLTDKNRKEIFEGDLIKYSGGLYTVKPPEWHHVDAFTVFGYAALDSFMDDYSAASEPSRVVRKGEVVGNI